MPDIYIHTLEEQEIQESWMSSMLDSDDEPRFWLNTLNTLEEANTFPSELKI